MSLSRRVKGRENVLGLFPEHTRLGSRPAEKGVVPVLVCVRFATGPSQAQSEPSGFCAF